MDFGPRRSILTSVATTAALEANTIEETVAEDSNINCGKLDVVGDGRGRLTFWTQNLRNFSSLLTPIH